MDSNNNRSPSEEQGALGKRVRSSGKRLSGRRAIRWGVLFVLLSLPGFTILAWDKSGSLASFLGHGLTASLASFAAILYSYERAEKFPLTAPDAMLGLTILALLLAITAHGSTLISVASGANVIFTVIAYYCAPRQGVLRQTKSDPYRKLLIVVSVVAPLYAVLSICIATVTEIELFYKDGWIFKGAFRNPNTFGTLALASGVTSTILSLARSRIGACLFLLNCALVIATGARGCLFAFVLFLVLAFLYTKPLITTAGLLLATLLFASGVIYVSIEDLDFASKLGLVETLQVRYEIWQEVATRIRAAPLVGHGTDSEAMYIYLPGRDEERGAHNGILAAALRYGLPACILYLGFIAAWVIHVWRRARHTSAYQRIQARILVIGVLAITSQALVRDSFILPSSLNIASASVLVLMGAAMWQARTWRQCRNPNRGRVPGCS